MRSVEFIIILQRSEYSRQRLIY